MADADRLSMTQMEFHFPEGVLCAGERPTGSHLQPCPGSRDLAGPTVFPRWPQDTPHPHLQCDLGTPPLKGRVPVPSLNLAWLANCSKPVEWGKSDAGETSEAKWEKRGSSALLAGMLAFGTLRYHVRNQMPPCCEEAQAPWRGP